MIEHDDLFGGESRRDGDPPTEPGFHMVDPMLLRPCPWPSRIGESSPAADEELDRAVKRHSILEPILAMWLEGALVIIAGMRRWRSALRTGLTLVPIRILDVSPEEAQAITLIENSARLQLRPWEAAVALLPLIGANPDVTVDAVIDYTGWSRGKAHSRLVIARKIKPKVLMEAGADLGDLNQLTLSELTLIAEEPWATRGELLREILNERDSAGTGASTMDAEEDRPAVGQDEGDSPTESGRGRDRSDAPVGERQAKKKRSGKKAGISNPSCFRDCSGSKGYVLLRVTGGKVDGTNREVVIEHVTRLLDHIVPDVEGLAEAVSKWAGTRLNRPRAAD